MKFTQTKKGIINNYKASKGSRIVNISEDTEKAKNKCVVVAYLNNGETVSHSKSFNSLVGAQKYATKWLVA